MATTIPAGSRILAEDLSPITNAVDNLLSSWTTYTPAWAASAGSVSLGNGTLTGRHKTVGKTVHLQVAWLAGSTTTYGTAGAFWTFGLPSGHVAAATAQGACTMLDVGVLEYGGICRILAGASVVELFRPVSARVLNNSPFTPGNGDSLSFSLTYEIT